MTDMTIRREFLDEVLTSLEGLDKKAQTNGEHKLLCIMALQLQESLDFTNEE